MKKPLNLIIVLISIATILSGLTQVFMPGMVLKTIGADITPATTQFFATIGMFMAVFGGMMLHAVYSPQPNPVVVTWSALQKFGASVAVGIGIAKGILAPIASGVALFDLFSGLLFLYYLKSTTRNEGN